MLDRLRAHEVWVFLCLIVVANALFIGAIAIGILPERLYNLGRFLLLGLVLAGVVFGFRGFEGVKKLVAPMRVWRVAPWWYLLVLLWAPVICTLVLIGKGFVTGADELVLNFEVVSRGSVMRTIAIGSFIGEIVWVSYAIGLLAPRFTLFMASLIVGTFWTLWWLPIVKMGVGVIPGLPLMALLVNMLGVAAMCGFVYHHTRSGLVVLILQITFNSSLLLFPVSPTSGGIPTYWTLAVIYSCCATLMYLFFGPRPLFPARTRLSVARN